MSGGPGPDTKGGGQRGGPRRWTGTGPRPARHIPWPELFKHHQSVLAGHLKMMDMVRKHCVEGSGNHNAAQACVDRTHEMMRMFKRATASFVAPPDNLDRVPLGASSASMYPGYSPADHIYGEAASEFGTQASEAKRKGIELDLDPNGPEYVIGQSQGDAKEQIEIFKRQRADEEKKKVGGETSGVIEQNATEATADDPMVGVEKEQDTTQLFMFDSNPTPIDVLQGKTTATVAKGKNKANDKAKRRVSFQDEVVAVQAEPKDAESHKKKKVKMTKTKDVVENETKPVVAEDDISAEVDARLKAKEERRKRKEEKKRKRETDSSLLTEDTSATAAPVETVELSVGESSAEKAEKPKKKKSKKEKTELAEEAGEEIKPNKEEKKSKRDEEKKSKKDKEKKKQVSLSPEAAGGVVEGEKPKKKRKKESSA